MKNSYFGRKNRWSVLYISAFGGCTGKKKKNGVINVLCDAKKKKKTVRPGR